MKKAALDAVEASKPVNVFFGNVVKTNPLKIKIEQKMTLEIAQLILTQNVVHSGLIVGDKVILLREQGGQRFIVLDRLGGM
jgi:hypothetical protein